MGDTEQAIQSFLVAPEVYQQLFEDQGIDFPDDLVAAVQQSPEQAIQLIQDNQDLQKGIQAIFNSNRETIMQSIQQKQEAQAFKLGGMMPIFSKGGALRRKVVRAQDGTKFITRREARDAAMNGINGYDYRYQFRTALRNMRHNLAKQNPDMSRGDIRRQARSYVWDSFQPHNVYTDPAYNITDPAPVIVPAEIPKAAPIVMPPKPSEEEVATQVIRGTWGSGADRIKALAEAGYDPKAVQAIVNERMRSLRKPTVTNTPATPKATPNAVIKNSDFIKEKFKYFYDLRDLLFNRPSRH